MTDRTPTTRSDRLAAVAFVVTVTLTLLFILGSLWPADATIRCTTNTGTGCVVKHTKPPYVPDPGHLCPRPTPTAPVCGGTWVPKPQPPITWGGAVR